MESSKELITEKQLGKHVIADSFCRECGTRTESIQHLLCDDCEEYIDSLDDDDYYDDEDESDFSDFDCTCGAWEWDDKSGKPIHIADCFCGSSEPW